MNGANNIAGRLARLFVSSRLTPLFILAVTLAGVLALLITPREENPQIAVPAVRVDVSLAGASALEVEQLVLIPLEGMLSELRDVRHTYGFAAASAASVTVQFDVGLDNEDALVRVYQKLDQSRHRLPPEAGPPAVTLHDVDDVPVVVATLYSETFDDYGLRRIADRIADRLRSVPDVSVVEVFGGRVREVRVELDPERAQAFGVTLDQGIDALAAANRSLPAGAYIGDNRRDTVFVAGQLTSAQQVEQLVVGDRDGRFIYVSDVADVVDGPPDERRSVTRIGFGSGAVQAPQGEFNAVSIAVAKERGSNAVAVADQVLERIAQIRQREVPQAVSLVISRNDGAKADQAVNDLIWQLGGAIGAVLVILMLFLGHREALIVTGVVPLSLFLVLIANYFLGITINRVTLFALIVALGSLVDAAIVVVENIHRRFATEPNAPKEQLAVDATAEVGPATNFATFAIMAVFGAMIVLTDVQSEYFFPITIDVPIAMGASLLVAYLVPPWAARRWLRADSLGGRLDLALDAARIRKVRDDIIRNIRARLPAAALEQLRSVGAEWRSGPAAPRGLYDRLLCRLLDRGSARRLLWLLLVGGVTLSLLQPLWQFLRPQGVAGAVSPLGVGVTFLPRYESDTFSIQVDGPESAPVQQTDRVSREISRVLRAVPEVDHYIVTVGAAGPPDLAGVVRGSHYRNGAHQAEIRVNLVPDRGRERSSVAVVRMLRPAMEQIAAQYPGTDIRLLEDPPGPPLQAMLVAELYGRDLDELEALTVRVADAFHSTYDVAEVHHSLEAPVVEHRIEVDHEKAALSRVNTEQVIRVVQATFGELKLGSVHLPGERHPVPVVVEVPVHKRFDPRDLERIYVINREGQRVPLSAVTEHRFVPQDRVIKHKDNERMEFVAAEIVHSSPIYAVADLNERVGDLRTRGGDAVRTSNLGLLEEAPNTIGGYLLLWQGESRLMLNSFREMFIALGIAVTVVYLLLVGYYRSFVMPLLAMVSLPLALIGVFPGHWVMGADFASPSIVGIIALTGVGIRGSLLIIDFIQALVAEGTPLREAVRTAGAIRLRPIFLTAATIVVGSVVMITDPVFGGLAISLIFGTLTATALTVFVVPVLYYRFARR